jgi:hypothetical protein
MVDEELATDLNADLAQLQGEERPRRLLNSEVRVWTHRLPFHP